MKKKILSIFLAIVMLLAIAPVSVFAEDNILDYLTYEINDGEVTITDCDTSISGAVTIPDTIEGYPVTTIDGYAFSDCTSLTEITIPDSVTSIGGWAFFSCTSLTEITIPDSVTSIGEYAFLDCTSLTEITIPNSVALIGNNAVGYYWTPDDYNLVDGFIIYGVSGSAAEKYANENGITFLILTDEPTTDEPTTDEPATDEPATDEPTTDKPATDILAVLAPNADSNITVADKVAKLSPEMTISDIIASVENDNIAVLDKDGNAIANDALVGTGSKINVLDKDGKVLSTYEVMVKSDVDGNGKVTPADARLALRAAAGLDNIEGVYEIAANYDGKDSVTTSDARMILRKAVGLE